MLAFLLACLPYVKKKISSWSKSLRSDAPTFYKRCGVWGQFVGVTRKGSTGNGLVMEQRRVLHVLLPASTVNTCDYQPHSKSPLHIKPSPATRTSFLALISLSGACSLLRPLPPSTLFALYRALATFVRRAFLAQDSVIRVDPALQAEDRVRPGPALEGVRDVAGPRLESRVGGGVFLDGRRSRR